VAVIVLGIGLNRFYARRAKGATVAGGV
jgi:hypothetical protein